MFTHHILHGTKPTENCHSIIVPVRYPESDSLLYIDIVQFYLDQERTHLQLVDELEAEFWNQTEKNTDIADRLTAGEAAFDTIAAKYNGAWEYLKSDAHCAEFH